MATTTKFATSASGTSWTNASNVLANDAAYATYTIAARTTTGNQNTLSNFGFDSTIPVGSTINSVTLEVEHKVSTTASIANLNSAVAINATLGTTNTDSTEPTTDTIRTYSSVTRPGGGAWTRDDLLDGTFTVRLWASSGNSTTSCTYSWDYATVTVDYTAPVNATTTVTGISATASAGTVTASASTNATATITGTSATSSFGTVSATGTASKTVAGIDATSAGQGITAAGNGTATATGTEVTSFAGTVTASGTTVFNAIASVTGASSTSEAQSVSGTGDALQSLTGAEATSDYGFVSAESTSGAHANVSGDQVQTGIADIGATGDALTSTTGAESTSYSATITANGSGGVQNAVANVSTVQAIASAGTVRASNQESKQPAGRFRGGTTRIIHRKNATAKVVGVDAFAIAGRVFAIGSVNVRVKVKPAEAKTGATVPVASGIQNPTDEQLLMMLLA